MTFNARSLTAGIVGGLAGGLMFGIMMTAMDMMGMVAGLANSSSIAVGWVIHLVISAGFGIAFAVVLGALATRTGRAAGLGAVYGMIAWVAGALVAMPLMLGMPALQIGQTQFLSLIGHVIYGVVAGVVYQRLAGAEEVAPSRA